jgi:hypothetical protein
MRRVLRRRPQGGRDCRRRIPRKDVPRLLPKTMRIVHRLWTSFWRHAVQQSVAQGDAWSDTPDCAL